MTCRPAPFSALAANQLLSYPPRGRNDRDCPLQLLYTVEEAAQLLGIGRTTMYVLVASREVESVKIGNLRRIPASTLHSYVDRLVSTNGTGANSQGGSQ